VRALYLADTRTQCGLPQSHTIDLERSAKSKANRSTIMWNTMSVGVLCVCVFLGICGSVARDTSQVCFKDNTIYKFPRFGLIFGTLNNASHIAFL
jgi:hypothetical protein